MTSETLYNNEWLSLKKIVDVENGINGYVYSHEERCQGIVIAILPYRYTDKFMEVMVKSEVTPCWSILPIRSAVTGGYEGIDPADDAVREMLEETGYVISTESLEPLGTCYASKSSDTIYSLYAVNVTNLEPGEALGDGTRLEAESITEWLTLKEATQIQDAQFSTMVFRLLGRS